MTIGAATAGAGGGHPAWHLTIVAIASVAVFAGIKAWEWGRSYAVGGGHAANRARLGVAKARLASTTARRRPWARPSSPLVVVVALASAGCSATHAAVGPAHFREAAEFGVFFVVASALQATWALLVVRRAGLTLLAVGSAGNAVVLGLWVFTRTVGLPFGPEIWRPEPVARPDALASLLELTVVLGALWLLFRQTNQSEDLATTMATSTAKVTPVNAAALGRSTRAGSHRSDTDAPIRSSETRSCTSQA